MVTIDFETEAIEGNPIKDPPLPVGVSVKYDDQPSAYLAWGHPTENNATWEQGQQAVLKAVKTGEWLAHNAQFEAAILRKYFHYETRDPLKVHDTMYLLFLTNPYASTFALKPSAERVLGLAPDEQTAVRDWVLRNVPGAKVGDWGAYIGKAPGTLVGQYAKGDTDRTKLLYDKLHLQVLEHGMLDAYRREQRLAPILSASSVRGVRVDVDRLARDIEVYTSAMAMADDYIRQRLGDFNIDSDAELAAALDKAGQVTDWVLTPTGRRSTARKNLVGRVKDPALLHCMAYRGVLGTCLGTFAGPWLQAAVKGGRLHAQWNQTRGEKGADGDMSGTKTGRMSCKAPNLQNIPNEFEGLVIPDFVRHYIEASAHTQRRPIALVPHMRVYCLPELGHTWVKRDFSAQEMRIMAHYAEGKLFDAFQKDPLVDPHVAVQGIIKELTGLDLPRKHVKTTGFGIMYGMGKDKLAQQLNITPAESGVLRDAYYAALPEVRDLSNGTRQQGKLGKYIRTWGSRVYYREPNLDRDLSYKLLNYLIQGSGADQAKQSIIDYDKERHSDDVFVAAVHDELNTSIPSDRVPDGMDRLRGAMDKPRFDVPFRSEGYVGANWSELTKVKDA